MKTLFLTIALFVAAVATGSVKPQGDMPSPPCPPECMDLAS